MAYWLYKSEPGTWSWDDQVKAGTTFWDGVRNPQANANMKAMQLGDRRPAAWQADVAPRPDVVVRLPLLPRSEEPAARVTSASPAAIDAAPRRDVRPIASVSSPGPRQRDAVSPAPAAPRSPPAVPAPEADSVPQVVWEAKTIHLQQSGVLEALWVVVEDSETGALVVGPALLDTPTHTEEFVTATPGQMAAALPPASLASLQHPGRE